MLVAQWRAQAQARDKESADEIPTRPANAGPIWQPQHRTTCKYTFESPGDDCDCPQVVARRSEADIIGFGGEAGGGKTDLLLGLAGLEHYRAVIFRREFPRLRKIIDRSRQIYNREGADRQKDRYNESLHVWRLLEEKEIEFGALQYDDDKKDWQGRDHDFYGFDEATEFLESQVRFVIGWLRSTRPGQRCRVVLTFNPPMDQAGQWVVEFFKPWLAYLHPKIYQHPNPAKPGELRWYTTGPDNKDIERPNGDPFPDPITGEMVKPLSRTFIPAKLSDNPILESTGYARVINAMPEPFRSLLKGHYGAGMLDDPWQVIPRAWVLAAIERWKANPTRPMFTDQHGRIRPVPMAALGVDVARGGQDKTCYAPMYGVWFAPVRSFPGAETPTGRDSAALAISFQENGAPIGVELTGVGSACYEALEDARVNVVPIVAGSGSSATDRTEQLLFFNKRAEMTWKLREALDPITGYGLMLPDDSELLADLCAPRFWMVGGKIHIEGKEDDKDESGKRGGIKQRLGRSPNAGDAVTYAWYTATLPPPDQARVIHSPVRIGNY